MFIAFAGSFTAQRANAQAVAASHDAATVISGIPIPIEVLENDVSCPPPTVKIGL